MNRREARRLLATLQKLSPLELRQVWIGLEPPAQRAIMEEWWYQAHRGQIEPRGDWRVWSIIAGRGFGKTRVGAEWVWERARACPDARIALVAASLDDVAKVMVDGESGLLCLARCDEEPRWVSSRNTLHFPSGATAYAYSAERPGKLRGPQHHFAWADELAKWPRPEETWSNLMLGLRLGTHPRTTVTTTPQPLPLLTRLIKDPNNRKTEGRTDQNPHLPATFVSAMRELYGGTRLGRQELDGVLFEDLPGALWTREMLEAARAERPAALLRVVVGVDPPASADGDACGIVVCGLGTDEVAYVLADHSAGGLRPEGWARRVAAAAAEWRAGRIVAEKNQGGDMVESVLRGVDSSLPVRLVSATSAKAARAEPVAVAFETGRARLAGAFPELEDELCALTYRGFRGSGSPDRADAMVWAMSELLKRGTEPRVLRL